MVHLYVGVHEVATELCRPDLHCFSCQRDEEGPAYIACGECMHLYPSARSLRTAYRRGFTDLLRNNWTGAPWFASNAFRDSRLSLLWIWLRCRLARAKSIAFCPLCLHDF